LSHGYLKAKVSSYQIIIQGKQGFYISLPWLFNRNLLLKNVKCFILSAAGTGNYFIIRVSHLFLIFAFWHPYLVLKIFGGTLSWFSKHKYQGSNNNYWHWQHPWNHLTAPSVPRHPGW